MSDKLHRVIIWLTLAIGIGLILRMVIESIRMSE